MVAMFIFAAVVTATPTATATATPTPTPRPTVASMTAPMPGANSETYGRKIPFQLREQNGEIIEAEPTPEPPPNSLAAVAARIKLNRQGNAPIRYVDLHPSKPPAWLDPNWKPGPDAPEYVSKVHMQAEGDDGVLVYFALAAADTHITRGQGHLVLTISQGWRDLYRLERDVVPAEFEELNIGVGAFEHRTMAFSTGRISFTQFRDWPYREVTTAKVSFTRPDGKNFTGSDSMLLEPRPRAQ